MNEQPDNAITLCVEGLDSEGGHVRLDDLLEQLEHLLTTLNGIDRLVSETGAPTLYYRVTKASHSSPLRITLEPVVKPTVKLKAPAYDYIKSRHKRFFGELSAIKSRQPVSPDIDESMLEHLREFTAGLGSTFKAATISNGAEKVEVDREFDSGLRRLLNEEDVSYGTSEGTLDALNIHGATRRFWIYPQLGPKKIRCDFLPGEKARLREAIGHYIRVEGVKYFRPNNPYPVRISVREFEILAEEDVVPLSKLMGVAPGVTGGMGSVEFVRAIRDEWG